MNTSIKSTPVVGALLGVLLLGTTVRAVLAQPTQDQEPPSSESRVATEADARDIARAYVDGISGGDLDELDRLFLPGDNSSVYENGSDEGSWPHYKEHHLAPEQAAVKNFKFETSEEVVEACGTGFLVRHVGIFGLEARGQIRTYRAAVSYVLVPQKDGLRISHLHWSSRQTQ